jgi:hypothetical protein
MPTIELSKSREDVGRLVKARDELAATLEQVLAGLRKEFGVPLENYWESSLSGGSKDHITFSTETFRDFMMKRG